MTSALSYFDGYTTARLPANLLQAQQNELQSKYLALYNMQMLNFYNGK